MLASAVAVVVGLTAVVLGVAWLRTPHRIHEMQVTYLGGRRRDPGAVERGAVSRGMALFVLGLLCLLVAIVTWPSS